MTRDASNWSMSGSTVGTRVGSKFTGGGIMCTLPAYACTYYSTVVLHARSQLLCSQPAPAVSVVRTSIKLFKCFSVSTASSARKRELGNSERYVSIARSSKSRRITPRDVRAANVTNTYVLSLMDHNTLFRILVYLRNLEPLISSRHGIRNVLKPIFGIPAAPVSTAGYMHRPFPYRLMKE